jgi:hypothetical protein
MPRPAARRCLARPHRCLARPRRSLARPRAGASPDRAPVPRPTARRCLALPRAGASPCRAPVPRPTARRCLALPRAGASPCRAPVPRPTAHVYLPNVDRPKRRLAISHVFHGCLPTACPAGDDWQITMPLPFALALARGPDGLLFAPASCPAHPGSGSGSRAASPDSRARRLASRASLAPGHVVDPARERVADQLCAVFLDEVDA